ncbi:MAG: 1-acyl-sn-glycerol-3-phosphate acyltransferase [Saprospiraceae bacterium]|nr:1-acyl-sn-glycerol-3-phosphate acyltransferase [Candidatus Vicinibacter proximus]MBL7824238.1 1-acyl-sn-glycerol-3-phosphate acyltransferase [Saprospiraceae bacterium]MCC6843501.1 1-acyl-sn-glycerol-3-phosphate acyltransferase [Saprospiraceae bacterium]HRG31777.1 1-acyl-sn-glycerol-3-phosphate acyltransferase [Saprospiraceae bacterium]
MDQQYPHILKEISDWPVYKLSQKRKEFVHVVENDVLNHFDNLSKEELDQILAKTIYQEKQRIKSNPWKADPPNEMQFFRKLQKEYNDNHSEGNTYERTRESVFRLIKRYTEEISGHFNVNTFYFARKALTMFFTCMFFPIGWNIFSSQSSKKKRLTEAMILKGEVESVRKLCLDHTIILVPTHSSNLDSILVGYMVDAMAGLPAFSYGAGLNLFDSEFFAFFMNRLGAYKVDRRKKNQIYLQTLSSYSKLIAMEGVHSIFFPGGTRSRSGEVESRLKLGLLNSLLLAQRNLIQQENERKIILVPAILSYESVLEARSLIIQHLKTTGQEKFTTREPSFSLWQYITFLYRFVKKSSKVYMTLGSPMDVFGNSVNVSGDSISQTGTIINQRDYFLRNGKLVWDTQRESIYTKELSEKIIEQYKKYNYILPSHLVAFAAFRLLSKLNPGQDIYNLVQLPEEEMCFPEIGFRQLCIEIKRILNDLSEQGRLIKSEEIQVDIDLLIDKGINELGVYHSKRPLKRDEHARLVSEDYLALLFYSNKLANLEIEDLIQWENINLQI